MQEGRSTFIPCGIIQANSILFAALQKMPQWKRIGKTEFVSPLRIQTPQLYYDVEKK